MDISERLVILFKEKNVTPYRLSKEIYISQSALGNYVRGIKVPNKAIVKLISLFYDVSFEWLYNGEGDMYLKVPLPVGHKKSESHDKNISRRCPECEKTRFMVEVMNKNQELMGKLISVYENIVTKQDVNMSPIGFQAQIIPPPQESTDTNENMVKKSANND